MAVAFILQGQPASARNLPTGILPRSPLQYRAALSRFPGSLQNRSGQT